MRNPSKHSYRVLSTTIGCHDRHCFRGDQRPLITLICCLLSTLLPAFASATVYFVSPSGSDANDGLSVATPKQHIQAALNAAASGDQIRVSAGNAPPAVYHEHISVGVGKQLYGGYNSDFSANDPVTYETILDGDGTGKVVTHGGAVATPNRVVDGFTVQNGQYDFMLPGTDMTVSRCKILGNIGSSAAAIATSGNNNNLTVQHCIISNNAGTGVLLNGNGSTTITDCMITDNQFGVNGYGSLQLLRNTISNNVTTAYYGGGVVINGPSATIVGNTIQDNSAGYTSGIYVLNANTVTITDNIIAGNTTNTTTNGKSFAIQQCASLILQRNTVTGNYGGYVGGGHIYDTNNVDVSHNVFADNHGTVGGGLLLAGGAHVAGGSWNVSDNQFVNNLADIQAAALEVGSNAATIERNTLTGNTSSQNYGACNIHDGNFLFLNNTITGNTAPNLCVAFSNATGTVANNLIAGNYLGWAGTLYTTGATTNLDVVNNTIVDNFSATGEAAVRWNAAHGTLVNNIVAYNNAGVAGNRADYVSCNCVFGNTQFDYLVPALGGPGDIDADPLFISRATGDYRLLLISPCIDAGDDSVIDPTWTDLNGLPRIRGKHVDIGAYEFQGVPRIVCAYLFTRNGSDIFVDVTLTNVGTATAQSVQITTATLGSKTSAGLPISMPDIAAGAGQTLVHALRFNAADFASGARTLLTLGGAYTGGTFSATLRVSVP